MRTICAFGMERFWGEHLRLLQSKSQSDREKGEFVADTWSVFWSIMDGISPALASGLPKTVEIRAPEENGEERAKRINQTVTESAQLFWQLETEDQRNCLAMLSALCDAVVWWTQRLKPVNVDFLEEI